MGTQSQERPSQGLQRLVSICRDVYLGAPLETNPLVAITDFVDGMSTVSVRQYYELLLTHNIAVTLSGELHHMTPLQSSKLFLWAYLVRELFTDEEVRARVLAGPHAGVLPAPATA